MNVSLYQAASALNANMRWQEVISQNLASNGIPGYKKQDLSFAAVQSGLMPRTAAPSGAPQYFTLPRASLGTNFLQGELQPTGNNTDFALEGAGFFVVQMPNGATAFTRDGQFRLNALGQLASKDGYLVLGDGGPIQLDLNNPAPLSVSPTGEVSQGDEVRGKLRVVEFAQPQVLTALGAGYFVNQAPNVVPNEVAQPSIRQGFIEASNMSAFVEMGNLITVMRGFEANQRVIQLQDERMSRAITELGGPN